MQVTDKNVVNQEVDHGMRDVRPDFPILMREVHGGPLVYLDSAATSQKPTAVLEAVDRYYERNNANVHRGIYVIAEEATAMFEAGRDAVANFINAPSRREVVFTRNASEAINLVAYAWGRETVRSGDAVAVTVAEHHSNFVPWQRLALKMHAQFEVVDVKDDGTFDLDQVRQVLTRLRPKIFAVTAVSNVLGTINPLQQLSQIAHDAGALILVDASQMAPHLPLDVQEIDADFVVFTGHKMLGPTGIGVLWGREQHLSAMEPFLYGGEMIKHVSVERTTWNDLPWKFEAGTPNIAGSVGLHAAVDYLSDLDMNNVRKHEKRLVAYGLDHLQSVDGLRVLGTDDPEQRGGVIAFSLKGIHPHDLSSLLDESGVCIRAGHHCAEPLHTRMGVPEGSARASFYIYNDTKDIDALCDAIRLAQQTMS